MTSTPRRIGIVTDTTASLPPGYAAQHGIEVVPQVIIFGDHSFLEDEEISYDEFLHELTSSGELPKTVAPMPREFIKAYTRQLADAETIFSIHPSRDVSGTYRSARMAKQLSFEAADIRIIDTRTVAGNLGTMVMLATQWAENGVRADEIVSRLAAMIPRGRTYLLVATLEYLRKGGRIGGAAALIGRVLQIRPLLELKGGHVEPLEKIRTRRRGLARLKELVSVQCPRTPEAHLCVMHAGDREEAERLTAELRTAVDIDPIPIYSVGASITARAGPGTLGVGFFQSRA